MMDALEPIKQEIYEIRGRRVMLDSDLAALYCVETKNLKDSSNRKVLTSQNVNFKKNVHTAPVCSLMVKVMQTTTIYSQHILREILLQCTSRTHCSLYDQSFVSSNHKQPNELRSQIHYRATGYTHVRGLHHSSTLRASAPS